MKNPDFAKNITPDLKPLFAKVLDRFFLCQSKSIPYFTEFFDPVKANAFAAVLSSQNGKTGGNYSVPAPVVKIFGGYDDAERVMLGFFPADFDEELPAAFPIKRLRVTHNAKFSKQPRHQDYLGAIIGLGIERDRVGDIIISDEYALVFVSREIAGFLSEQLMAVGRVPVKVAISDEKVEAEGLSAEKESRVTVSSMRLDVVLAAVFRLSRSKTAALIAAEKAFVNWKPAKNTAALLKPGDIMTLRGYGRARVGEAEGVTKKERIRLLVYTR